MKKLNRIKNQFTESIALVIDSLPKPPLMLGNDFFMPTNVLIYIELNQNKELHTIRITASSVAPTKLFKGTTM